MDRNKLICFLIDRLIRSLSSRRAWIEIVRVVGITGAVIVALLTESVDRNRWYLLPACTDMWSLSSRRAWIEIALDSEDELEALGRSPHGERG